jgi:hypothetical protein
MSNRLELHDILCELVNITEPNGDRHIYFNPLESVKMKYPAIRYKRKKIDKIYANNLVYKFKTCYELVVIHADPDDDLIEKVLALPYCEHDRQYISNNLVHDVFTLFY